MTEEEQQIEFIKSHINSYPDFPKPGIIFRDIFSVLQEPQVFSVLCEVLINRAKKIAPPVQCIAALESRGFLFGPIIALNLKVPFVPIRKKGKLPGRIESIRYNLEYGQDTLEMQIDSIKKGERVLLMDDLLATGGSLSSACQLISKSGADVVQCLVIMELTDLQGRTKIPAQIHSLVTY